MSSLERVSSLFRVTDPSVPRTRLRKAVESSAEWPTICPLVHDAMSAKLGERAGFGTVVVSGYAVSTTRLGLPDAGFLSLGDMSDVVRSIAARTSLAVIADCDTGHGNAISAMRAVEEMISVGAAGLFIEDQVAPKRCGMVAGKLVVPAEEFAGKLRALDRVRRELAPDFLIIARCDARGVAGGTVEDVIARGKMYKDAGADVIFPEALVTSEELAWCGEEIGGPLLYNMGGHSPILSREELRRMNVGIVFAGNSFVPALSAIDQSFRRLHDEGLSYLESAPVFNVHELAGFPEVMALENELLPSEDQLARYEDSVGYKPA